MISSDHLRQLYRVPPGFLKELQRRRTCLELAPHIDQKKKKPTPIIDFGPVNILRGSLHVHEPPGVTQTIREKWSGGAVPETDILVR